MTISYQQALDVLLHHADIQREAVLDASEYVPLESAVGRVTANRHEAPRRLPEFDSAAANGYALCSALTSNATDASPLTFFVYGTQDAGEAPMTIPGVRVGGAIPCVEIVRGAQFPKASTTLDFDACVPFEDTTELPDEIYGRKQITIRKPVPHNANRRFAGDDFHQKDEIIARDTTITPQHVLALASLGIETISVKKNLSVCIWSTASDHFSDATRPYIMSALEELDVKAEFLSVVENDKEAIKKAVRSADKMKFDIFIATGNTSDGQFDNLHAAVEACNAEVLFHEVAIQPGSPVLFASMSQSSVVSGSRLLSPQLSSDTPSIAFFGLPESPVALAACMKFFVSAYIKQRRSEPGHESLGCHLLNPIPPLPTEASARENTQNIPSAPQESDIFKHGKIVLDGSTAWAVPNSEQNTSRIKPFLHSSCWVHLPAGPSTKANGDVVRCYPIQEGSNFVEKIIFGHGAKDQAKSSVSG